MLGSKSDLLTFQWPTGVDTRQTAVHPEGKGTDIFCPSLAPPAGTFTMRHCPSTSTSKAWFSGKFAGDATSKKRLESLMPTATGVAMVCSSVGPGVVANATGVYFCSSDIIELQSDGDFTIPLRARTK